MLSKHPKNQLTAYVHGELDAVQADRVKAHLDKCGRCANCAAQIRDVHTRLSHLPAISAPDSLWRKIAACVESETNTRKRSPRISISWLMAAPVVTATVFTVFAIAMACHKHELRHAGPSWQVTRLLGRPMIASTFIGHTARLGVGQWLETDAQSQAEIAVADIGHVEVSPNTRIGLTVTRSNEHRLVLQRGEMSASVSAPPRLFFVDTPSTTAVDLGCAYTLKVEADGDSILHVLSGHVALTLPTSGLRGEREITVPAGGYCRTRKGSGPGSPFFGEASDGFKAALNDYDTNINMDASLETVLSQAQQIDTLSLWYMMTAPQATADRRARILSRMIVLIPPESGVTRAGLMNGDAEMLRKWHETLEAYW